MLSFFALVFRWRLQYFSQCICVNFACVTKFGMTLGFMSVYWTLKQKPWWNGALNEIKRMKNLQACWFVGLDSFSPAVLDTSCNEAIFFHEYVYQFNEDFTFISLSWIPYHISATKTKSYCFTAHTNVENVGEDIMYRMKLRFRVHDILHQMRYTYEATHNSIAIVWHFAVGIFVKFYFK